MVGRLSRRAAVVLLACCMVAWVHSAGLAAETLNRGKVDLRSIGALEFGPDSILFVADSQASTVWAIDVRAEHSRSTRKLDRIDDLDETIAAMLGTSPRDVTIQDMAVHEKSGVAYLSITRGKGDRAIPLLMRVDGSGEPQLVGLGDIPRAKLLLPNAPAADAKLYHWESKSFTITDLEFIDGELFIAGLSNEEFASLLRRTPFPFKQNVEVTGLEIFHGAHGEYETFAPIFSFIPYEIEGEDHLLAGYLCTPLVTFPLDAVRGNPRLRGKTIAELGNRNIPSDIVAYSNGREDFVLINNSTRGMMKMKGKDIAEASRGDGLTERVGPRSGVDYHTVPLGNVVQLSDYDRDSILILGREMDNGALFLRTVPKRRL